MWLELAEQRSREHLRALFCRQLIKGDSQGAALAKESESRNLK
jgi:hypothetical protein